MSGEGMTGAGFPGRPRIVFVTGTRADFGKLKPLMLRVAADERFEYAIFVTGMHLLARYGSTANEIRKSGFTNVHPFINQDGAVTSQMDMVLAQTIQGLGYYLRESTPDLVVVHGDRVEALAGAIAGALNNVLVAHIEGGELSGTVDELIRHATSKLSHLHFVANDDARRRLEQMGERSEAIFVIGSPDVDVMLSPDLPSLDETLGRYEIPFRQYCIAIYHPVTTEQRFLEAHTEWFAKGLLDSGRNFVVIAPNNDHGSEIIRLRFEKLEANPRFRMIPSMRFEHFLRLLQSADAIVGNSSAGIREAPVYGVPTIDVGSRQHNRFQSPSIHHVPEDAAALTAALETLTRHEPCWHFGRGNSADQFMRCIGTPSLWATERQKQFRDRA